MGKLVDYQCPYSEFKGLLTVDPKSIGLSVPELYQNAEDMAKMAMAMAGEGPGHLCRLPMDTIALAESLGADVIYDTSPTGPRKKLDVLKNASEVMDLPAADPTSGRLAEIIKGIAILKENGQIPVIALRGLFDTMNALIDLQKVIMGFMMDPSLMKNASDKLRKDIVTITLAAQEAGARMLSFEDGSGGLKVLGPMFVKKNVDLFLYPLMKELDEKLEKGFVIQMCPKVAFMLTGCDKAEFVKTPKTVEGSWVENYLANPEIRFTGSQCNRNIKDPAGSEITYMKLL